MRIEYAGADLAFVIDGSDGIDAAFGLAGSVGICPRGFTLRQIWLMAEGAARRKRAELMEQASLVWAMDDVDLEAYLLFGIWNDIGREKPLRMSPELERKVEEEEARLRKESKGELPIKER